MHCDIELGLEARIGRHFAGDANAARIFLQGPTRNAVEMPPSLEFRRSAHRVRPTCMHLGLQCGILKDQMAVILLAEFHIDGAP